MEWGEGGKWDNCNSIINKYIKKKVEDLSFKKGKKKEKETMWVSLFCWKGMLLIYFSYKNTIKLEFVLCLQISNNKRGIK